MVIHLIFISIDALTPLFIDFDMFSLLPQIMEGLLTLKGIFFLGFCQKGQAFFLQQTGNVLG